LAEKKETFLGVKVGIRFLVSLFVMQELHTEETKHLWEEASPTFQVRRMLQSDTDPNLPPYFMPHGTADALTAEKVSPSFWEVSSFQNKPGYSRNRSLNLQRLFFDTPKNKHDKKNCMPHGMVRL
jgi:hypothetical protein